MNTTAPGDCLTVVLIPKARNDLRLLKQRTSMSSTDLANRAITLYEFVDAQLRAGREMIARDLETGATSRVQLTDAPEAEVAPAGSAPQGRGRLGRRSSGRHRRQFQLPRWLPRLPLPGPGNREVAA